ncbi:hypothetical protein RchiOBHm_Chr5g0045681 [Rosa chinensis]|uniref:Uncharacterized protein n=1 Tax=Rosa chinensis TaxID=74649 RepID=A0A2P6QDX5_ROSCH|nr:hypothetical protein RchiOBHm_Chr5g0045681 [Rosa chinensis]
MLLYQHPISFSHQRHLIKQQSYLVLGKIFKGGLAKNKRFFALLSSLALVTIRSSIASEFGLNVGAFGINLGLFLLTTTDAERETLCWILCGCEGVLCFAYQHW